MNRRMVLAVVLAAAGFLGPAHSAEAQSSPPIFTVPQSTTATTADAPITQPTPTEERHARRSFVIPALEIVGLELVANRVGYYTSDKSVYDSTWSSIRRNATGKWFADTDPFETNQFNHPYSGSLYFGFARSAGLNYWTALAYAFGGSLLWEIVGETGPASYNDQISTSLSGSFLGEPLFRAASLLLEGGGRKKGFWRGLGGAFISPATGFNRLAAGDRFDAVLESRSPAVFTRTRIGMSRTDHVSQRGIAQPLGRKEAIIDFQMSYGLPGKSGYGYARPFDYFDFQFTAVNTNAIENIMSRGLLAGSAYGRGDSYRGIWGLYGSYDYISPQIFRVSTTALGLGTTGEWRLFGGVQLQGTLLAGIGYGAAGVTRRAGIERDYHYGATPQGLLSIRLLVGTVANFDMNLRGYYVSGVGSTEKLGHERIARGDAAMTVRVLRRHALTLKYVVSRRDASYPDDPNRSQMIGTFSLLYGFISDRKFGAVQWLGR